MTLGKMEIIGWLISIEIQSYSIPFLGTKSNSVARQALNSLHVQDNPGLAVAVSQVLGAEVCNAVLSTFHVTCCSEAF